MSVMNVTEKRFCVGHYVFDPKHSSTLLPSKRPAPQRAAFLSRVGFVCFATRGARAADARERAQANTTARAGTNRQLAARTGPELPGEGYPLRDARGLAIEDRGPHALGDLLASEADLRVQQGRLAVGDVAVWQADAQDPHAAGGGAGVVEGLPDR